MSEKFNNDPTIRRVRSLLKKAESLVQMGDENSQREADACNEKASELINKHGIDQALLAAKGEIQDAIISKRIPLPDPYVQDKRTLVNQIVLSLGGQVVFVRYKRPGTQQSYSYTAHVFAYESDMDRIEFLYEMLRPQMLLGAAAAPAPYWENARSFRKSWMQGFAIAIGCRLQRTQKEAVAEATTGTDLVIFDRNKAVEEAYKLAVGKTDNTVRKLNGSGLGQGYAAGQRASLGDNQLGNSRRAMASS